MGRARAMPKASSKTVRKAAPKQKDQKKVQKGIPKMPNFPPCCPKVRLNRKTSPAAAEERWKAVRQAAARTRAAQEEARQREAQRAAEKAAEEAHRSFTRAMARAKAEVETETQVQEEKTPSSSQSKASLSSPTPATPKRSGVKRRSVGSAEKLQAPKRVSRTQGAQEAVATKAAREKAMARQAEEAAARQEAEERARAEAEAVAKREKEEALLRAEEARRRAAEKMARQREVEKAAQKAAEEARQSRLRASARAKAEAEAAMKVWQQEAASSSSSSSYPKPGGVKRKDVGSAENLQAPKRPSQTGQARKAEESGRSDLLGRLVRITYDSGTYLVLVTAELGPGLFLVDSTSLSKWDLQSFTDEVWLVQMLASKKAKLVSKREEAQLRAAAAKEALLLEVMLQNLTTMFKKEAWKKAAKRRDLGRGALAYEYLYDHFERVEEVPTEEGGFPDSLLRRLRDSCRGPFASGSLTKRLESTIRVYKASFE